jgi:hypothetical protein
MLSCESGKLDENWHESYEATTRNTDCLDVNVNGNGVVSNGEVCEFDDIPPMLRFLVQTLHTRVPMNDYQLMSNC